MATPQKIRLPEKEIHALCEEFQVIELAVFGSYLRDDFRKNSDIDFLVTFQPEAAIGLMHVARLQHRLQDLLGRKVDLVMKEGLKPLLRDEVLSTARVVYAA